MLHRQIVCKLLILGSPKSIPDTLLDAWRLDGLHYFVFQLHPSIEDPDGPYALFTMRWEDNEPVSAVIVTPHAEMEKAATATEDQPV